MSGKVFWRGYLAKREPGCFIVEEVPAFQDIDPRSGTSYLAQFANQCAGEGYSVRAVVLNHGTWIDMDRARIFILGFSARCGHSAAADWAIEQLNESLRRCAMTGRASLLPDIVDPNGAEEEVRRERDEDHP